LELIVVVTIMGILLASATPAMQDLLLDARRTRVLNEILRALHIARAQSVRSGQEVVLCPRGSGEGCDGDGWNRGWLVFINDDGDQPAHLDDVQRLLAP
jgi:Tfp pilus assembly protein FimT